MPHMFVCAKSFQSCLTFCDPQTVARQAPLSMGFSRQACWSRLPANPFSRGSFRPRDWTHISCLLHGLVGSLPLVPPGKPTEVINSFAVQSLSTIQLFETPWTAACHLPSPSLSHGDCSNSCPLSGWCHPTISTSVVPSPSALNLSQHQGFSIESAVHTRGPKYWSFSFSISPSNEYSGLISFRIDWFDLFAVQGTLKSLLQHHSLKASILQCSAFFMIQLSNLTWLLETPYLWLYGPLLAKWCLCFLISCLGLSSLFFQGTCIF